MAQTHEDRDSTAFLERLEERADGAVAAGASQIASGAPGEEPLDGWEAHGVQVCQLPPDEQRILRISIGGGPVTPVAVNYCTFRGDRGHCVELLRRALRAMERTRE